MQRRHLYSTIALGLSLVAVGSWAATTAWFIPYTFTAGTPASASEVNANFLALVGHIKSLEQKVATLENNTVLALDGKLGLGTDSNTGQPTARFTGINVQIVNGTNHSYTSNGQGNLIIGYNETLASQLEFCSSGGWSSQSTCESHGNVWAADQRTGSHNLVVGSGNAYSGSMGVVAGTQNIINGRAATVTGGRFNLAGGSHSSVSGGDKNTAYGRYASVSGGAENRASERYTSVSGGQHNEAISNYASVSGGVRNTASGEKSSVSGGSWNKATGAISSISGGLQNKASDTFASVSGGWLNVADGNSASISGGLEISTTTNYQWCGGGSTSSPNCK